MTKNNKPDDKMIEIFAGTPWQAGMAKSLLENAGIETFMADQIIGTYNPWWTSGGGAGPIRVFISESDYAQAKLIIGEYEKKMQ